MSSKEPNKKYKKELDKKAPPASAAADGVKTKKTQGSGQGKYKKTAQAAKTGTTFTGEYPTRSREVTASVLQVIRHSPTRSPKKSVEHPRKTVSEKEKAEDWIARLKSLATPRAQSKTLSIDATSREAMYDDDLR